MRLIKKEDGGFEQILEWKAERWEGFTADDFFKKDKRTNNFRVQSVFLLTSKGDTDIYLYGGRDMDYIPFPLGIILAVKEKQLE